MQQKQRHWEGFGRKALSVLMAVVLAVGLMPLPAFADSGVVAGEIAGGSPALTDEPAANVDEGAEDADVEVPAEVAEMDFSTQRVIVAFDSGTLDERDLDNVVSEADGEFLLQYKNIESAQKAYVRYLDRAGVDFVAPDIVLDAADDAPSSSDADATEPADAPLAALDSDVVADGAAAASGPVVALIDTGAPEGDSRVTAYYSSLSSGELYDDSASKHGTSMLYTMAGEDADVHVMSVKALDADGRGTAATVSAAIGTAVEKGADVINLSFAGKATKSNAAINAAVEDAVAAGKTVIVAAGNDADDAGLYTPANAEGAFTVGSADEDGMLQPFSNWGDAVDAYVKSASTSRGAARASGWLSSYLKSGADASAWQGSLLSSELVGDADAIAAEVAEVEGDGSVQAAATEGYVSIKVVGGKDKEIAAQEYECKTTALAKAKLPSTSTFDSSWTPTGYTWAQKFVAKGDSYSASTMTFNQGAAPLGTTATSTKMKAESGADYTFYAVYQEVVRFHYKSGGDSGNTIYRYFIEDENGTRTSWLSTATLPAASDSDFTLLGWDTSAGGTRITDAAAAGAALGTTNYYEVCSRDFTAILGANGGIGGMTSNTKTVTQTYDGAAKAAGGSGYSIDTSPLESVNWSSLVPNDQWVLGGFQVSPSGERVVADGYSAEDVETYPAVHATSISDLAAKAGDAKFTQASNSTGRIFLNAVYKRPFTIHEYRTKALHDAGATTGLDAGDYYAEIVYQLCPMAYGSIASNQACSNPIFTLNGSNLDGYKVTKWNYNGTEYGAGNNRFASIFGMTRAWGATSPVSAKVYAVDPVEDTTTYTVKFVDGASGATTIGSKKTSAGSATSLSGITPTSLDAGYAAPTGCEFAGWALSTDSTGLTAVTSVGSGAAAGDTVTVQAIWNRDVKLYNGTSATTPAATLTKAQKWNQAAGKASLTVTVGNLGSVSGWDAQGWTDSSSTPTSASGLVSDGGAYNGTSSTLYAVYNRDVTLNYAHNPNFAFSGSASGWPGAPATAKQWYRSAGTASAATFTLASGVTTTERYDFKGWVETEAGTSPKTGTYSKSPAVDDSATLTVYDYWTAKAAPTLTYSVQHFKQNLDGTWPSTASETESKSATEGATVTATAKTYEGFTHTTSPAGATPVESATLVSGTVLKVYYNRNTPALTAPSAVDAGGTSVTFSVAGTSPLTTGGKGAFEDTITITAAGLPSNYTVSYVVPGVNSYLLGDDNGTATFTMPATDVAITAKVAEKSAPTASVTVKHFKQNTGGTYGTSPDETTTAAGQTVGSTVTSAEVQKTYAGFEIDASKSESVEVAASGTEIKVYYKRSLYRVNVPNGSAGSDTVSFAVSSPLGVNGAGTAATTTAAQGTTVTITPSGLPSGYKVSYTVSGGTSSAPVTVDAANGYKGTFTMPIASNASSGITVAATITSSSASTATYTVNHFKQTLAGTYPASPDAVETPEVAVPATVTAESAAENYTGYVFDASASSPASAEVTSGSSVVFNLKYKLATYALSVPTATAGSDTVTFTVTPTSTLSTGGTGSGTIAFGDTVKIEPSAALPTGFKVTGYTVSGGKTTPSVALSGNTGTFTMPAAAITGGTVTVAAMIASTTVEAGTYTVNHYKQNLDGTFGAPYKTEMVEGTVGETVSAADVAKAEAGFKFSAVDSSTNQTVATSGTVVNVKYTRMVYKLKPIANGTIKFDLSWKDDAQRTAFASSGARNATNGGTAQVAYGAEVVISPSEGTLPDDYAVNYYMVTASTSAIVFPTDEGGVKGAAVFEMPAPLGGANGTVTVSADVPDPYTTASYTAGFYKQELDGTYPAAASETDTNLLGYVGQEASEPAVADIAGKYDGFEISSDKAPSYGTIVEDGQETEPTVKVWYERAKRIVTAPSITVGDTPVAFAVSSDHASALGAENGSVSGTAAFGDTVRITPSSVPTGWELVYEVTGAKNGEPVDVTVSSNGVASFEMPEVEDVAAGLTVTATAKLDDSFKGIKVVEPHMGVTVKGTDGDVPTTAKKDEMVIVLASEQDGYEFASGSTWEITGVEPAAIIVNDPSILAFRMGAAQVTLKPPTTKSVLIERVALEGGGEVVTTTTTTYDGGTESAVVEVVGGDNPGTTYQETSIATSGVETTRTTWIYGQPGKQDLKGLIESKDDGLGTVTKKTFDATNQESGSSETVTVATGETTSMSTEMSYDKDGVLLAGYPKVTKTTLGAGGAVNGTRATCSYTTVSALDNTKGNVWSMRTLDDPYIVEESETTVSTLSTTVVSGATTTITTTAPATATVGYRTTTPVDVVIGGHRYFEPSGEDGGAVKVERTDANGTTVEYYRAFLEPSDDPEAAPGTLVAGFASDDASISKADATIVPEDPSDPSNTGATVTLAVAPDGADQQTGTSTMDATGATVNSLSATVAGRDGNDVTVSLTKKAREALDASKYWYALVVADEEVSDMTATAETVLSSEAYESSGDTRAFRVWLYRIARDSSGLVEGLVTEPSEIEARNIGVEVDLGTVQKNRQAHVGRVDIEAAMIDHVDTSLAADLGSNYSTNAASGKLRVASLGGTGELLVGLGTVRTITYVSNFPRTSGKAGLSSDARWSENASKTTIMTAEECPIGLNGWSIESWNTAPRGTGASFKPGEEVTIPDSGLTLYAQWKWNLTEPFTDALGYGTKIELFNDADRTQAYSATYDGNVHAPVVKVVCADGLAYKASSPYVLPANSYVVEYEKKYDARYDAAREALAYKDSETATDSWIPLKGLVAGDTTGAQSVVSGGAYRVKVKAAETASSKAAAGSFATCEFELAKASQVVTAEKVADQVYEPNKTFKIPAAVEAPAGVPAQAVGALSFASSDEKSVVVAADGTATIKGANVNGVTVTATAAETENFAATSAEVAFKVEKGTQTITVNQSQTVVAGKTTNLNAKLSNTEGKLTYVSKNSVLVSVNANGVVTGLGCNIKGTVQVSAAETANYKAAASKDVVFTISSGLKVTGKTISGKKSKKLTFKPAKYLTQNYNNTKGTLTYSIANASKVKKAKVSINKKNGTITVNKGAKGTYKINVKVDAALKAPYQKQTCTTTVTLKLK